MRAGACSMASAKPVMDEFTRQHLAAWLEHNELDAFIPETEHRMLAYVAEYPETLERNTWTEIRDMSDRWNYGKFDG